MRQFEYKIIELNTKTGNELTDFFSEENNEIFKDHKTTFELVSILPFQRIVKSNLQIGGQQTVQMLLQLVFKREIYTN